MCAFSGIFSICSIFIFFPIKNSKEAITNSVQKQIIQITSLTINTKMDSCHSSHLKQTTEDGISIWLHSSLFNKVSITPYLTMHSKSLDSETETTKTESGNIHEACTINRIQVFTVVLLKPSYTK